LLPCRAMPHSLLALLVAVVASGVLLPALAADCSGRFSAGYRVLPLDNGRKWRCGTRPKLRAAAGALGRRTAPSPLAWRAMRRPRRAARAAGAVLARLGRLRAAVDLPDRGTGAGGYVVAAPDHADAACAIGSMKEPRRMRIDKSFLDPASWSERSEVGRLHDLRAVIRLVAADPQLRGLRHLAHSGAWPFARRLCGARHGRRLAFMEDAGVKAVLALSPYVLPFVAHGALSRLQVPVMYQGAALDWGMTTSLEGAEGRPTAQPARAEVLR